MKNTCKSCAHWKNKQMLLNYCQHTGFCVNPEFTFNTNVGRLIGVVDERNLRDRAKVSGNAAHDFETVKAVSNYHLQTEENFGCVYHRKE
jgi:hypothetical protein